MSWHWHGTCFPLDFPFSFSVQSRIHQRFSPNFSTRSIPQKRRLICVYSVGTKDIRCCVLPVGRTQVYEEADSRRVFIRPQYVVRLHDSVGWLSQSGVEIPAASGPKGGEHPGRKDVCASDSLQTCATGTGTRRFEIIVEAVRSILFFWNSKPVRYLWLRFRIRLRRSASIEMVPNKFAILAQRVVFTVVKVDVAAQKLQVELTRITSIPSSNQLHQRRRCIQSLQVFPLFDHESHSLEMKGNVLAVITIPCCTSERKGGKPNLRVREVPLLK